MLRSTQLLEFDQQTSWRTVATLVILMLVSMHTYYAYYAYYELVYNMHIIVEIFTLSTNATTN